MTDYPWRPVHLEAFLRAWLSRREQLPRTVSIRVPQLLWMVPLWQSFTMRVS